MKENQHDNKRPFKIIESHRQTKEFISFRDSDQIKNVVKNKCARL